MRKPTNTRHTILLYMTMTGRIIFAQDNFSDGELRVAHLQRGSYLVIASTKQHRMARKLVIR
jgi:hypothetical protein